VFKSPLFKEIVRRLARTSPLTF